MDVVEVQVDSSSLCSIKPHLGMSWRKIARNGIEQFVTKDSWIAQCFIDVVESFEICIFDFQFAVRSLSPSSSVGRRHSKAIEVVEYVYELLMSVSISYPPASVLSARKNS